MQLQCGPFILNLVARELSQFNGFNTLSGFEFGDTNYTVKLSLEILSAREAFESFALRSSVDNEWRSGFREGQPVVQFWSDLTQSFSLEVTFDRGYGSCKIAALSNHPQKNELNYLLLFPLRWMVMHKVALDGGFLLNGVAIQHLGGSAFLGLGQPETRQEVGCFFNKQKEFTVLGDGVLALYPRAGGWRVWGTPLAGSLEAAKNKPAWIRKYYFLENGPNSQATGLRSREAFDRFWPSVLVPPSGDAISECAVDNVLRFVSKVPAEVFALKDDSFDKLSFTNNV